MNERILRTGRYKKIHRVKEANKPPRTVSVEIHEVLSADMRTTEFQGTFEECQRFLHNSCPTGGCED